MSYNIFILCHYGDTIVFDVNNNITYNGGSNLLLNDNLDMSHMEIKNYLSRTWAEL
jgi:hypothetical protein